MIEAVSLAAALALLPLSSATVGQVPAPNASATSNAEDAQLQADAEAFRDMINRLIDQAAPIRNNASLSEAEKRRQIEALLNTREAEIEAYFNRRNAVSRRRAIEQGGDPSAIDAMLSMRQLNTLIAIMNAMAAGNGPS
jgi:hypothetical protein